MKLERLIIWDDVRCLRVCVNYLMATQTNVEQVKVLRAFRGETWSNSQRGHIAQSAEVKGQRPIVFVVGE